ncbi:hypothetical protein SSS_06124 [Sarcoptes scabiei]|uniref:Uncharacterized protein n=1 Tax=Sarcoptes scabiei TaxID=52283 RepID=A0A834R6T8_SARSC|nr:hypothetical protein SSS_06124 [Sarcoptes scabiei]
MVEVHNENLNYHPNHLRVNHQQHRPRVSESKLALRKACNNVASNQKDSNYQFSSPSSSSSSSSLSSITSIYDGVPLSQPKNLNNNDGEEKNRINSVIANPSIINQKRSSRSASILSATKRKTGTEIKKATRIDENLRSIGFGIENKNIGQ